MADRPKRGRPTLDPKGALADHYLRVRVSVAELEQLRAAAERDGRTLSAVIREAMGRWLNSRQAGRKRRPAGRKLRP